MSFDAIVVGARCAGAATAMLLARFGHRVLLVDRASFPSDVPHGHFIHRNGPRQLARWGLLDRVLATGCPPVTSMTVDLGDFPLTGRHLSAEGAPLGIGPRRFVLDKILVDAAVAAGAHVRERFTVDELVVDGDAVVGVRGHDAGGAVVTERATITIGADGRHSRLARMVKADAYNAVPPLTCWYFSYWADVPNDGVELYVRGTRAVFCFPTGDGLLAVFVVWPASEFANVRADIEREFMAVIDDVAPLSDRLRNGRRAERFLGASDLPNFLRKPFGRGWALVGDAGCHKDPYLALGIRDAFRDAELLANAINAGFSGNAPMELPLADYEYKRNEATIADYKQNLESARFRPPPPDVLELRKALRGRQAEIDRFFLAYQGMAPRESFFNVSNIQRVIETFHR